MGAAAAHKSASQPASQQAAREDGARCWPCMIQGRAAAAQASQPAGVLLQPTQGNQHVRQWLLEIERAVGPMLEGCHLNVFAASREQRQQLLKIERPAGHL